MRTVNIFTFDELSEESKRIAICNFKPSGGEDLYNELKNSVDALCKQFNLRTGRTYSDLRVYDDKLQELTGLQLRKYIVSNFELYKNVYIRTIHKKVNYPQFICKPFVNYKGETYTQIYSKNRFTKDCILTGVSFDDEIMHPIYDFLKSPKGVTGEDLICNIELSISKAFESVEEWLDSEEYKKEELYNSDFEYLEDGTQI